MTTTPADPPARPGSRSPRFGNMRGETGRLGTGQMSDDKLAESLDIGVPAAHAMIEDVTGHRSTDLDLDD